MRIILVHVCPVLRDHFPTKKSELQFFMQENEEFSHATLTRSARSRGSIAAKKCPAPTVPAKSMQNLNNWRNSYAESDQVCLIYDPFKSINIF